MLHPMLFIGCGGSGGKTLRVARRAILRRLESVGWDGGMPAAWQFLHIDVPRGQEGSIDDFGPWLPQDAYVNLVDPGVEYRGVDIGLLSGFDDGVTRNTEALSELVGWRPNPNEVHVPVEEGAGQYRAVGRMIALNNATRLATAASNVIDTINTAAAHAELRLVSERFGAAPGSVPGPVIIMVSSLAGGTGAGCFMDVADILRAQCGPIADHMIALLYTSDVFRDVDGVEGVDGNSLAALAELMAGYLSDDARKMAMLTSTGVRARPMTRGGPSRPFLIGAANTSGIALHDQVEVYRAVGEALAMVTASPAVQESLVHFVITNWPMQAAGNRDTLGLTVSGEYGVSSSLGYARLGLGRDRFREYAVKRLARDAAEFLQSGYIAAARATWPTQAMTPTEARQRTVEYHSERFLDACRLNERNHDDRENNQIIDALRPTVVAEAWTRAVKSILDEVRPMAPAPTDTWLQRIRTSAALKEAPFAREAETALLDSAFGWADEMPGHILDTTADYVAALGIPIAIGLLERTVQELRSVADQLIIEADALATEGANWMGRVGTILPVGENITGQFHHLEKVVREVTSPWYYDMEAKLRDRASELMVELADEVLAPLLETLRAGQHRLEGDLVPKSDRGISPVTDWPRENVVPEWLRPSEVERLLDDVDGYPRTFIQLVKQSLGQDEAIKELGPTVVARRQVLAGGFPSAAAEPIAKALRQEDRLSRMERAWRPRAAGGSGESTHFVAEFDLDALIARAEAWVDRPGPFKDHLDESLSRYLEEHTVTGRPVVDHAERLARFRSCFETALSASAPLIAVDQNVYKATHPNRRLEVAQLVEPLPFPTGHPARRPAEEILRARLAVDGRNPDAVAGLFATAGADRVDSIGIVSYLAAPVHPVVFKSVVDPIATKFLEGGPGFWQWRRTRTLPESIPVQPKVRRAMIRGWFTARLLGMLDTTVRNKPYRVFDAGTSQWLPFPYPLLGSVPDSDSLDQLAAVFESMPLSFLGWSVWGQRGQVAAYRRLLHLGTSDAMNLDDALYRKANAELADWLTSGTAAPGCSPLADVDHGTREERAKSTQALLEMNLERYRRVAATPWSGANLLGTRRGQDLADDIVSELENLLNAVIAADKDILDF